MNVIKRGCCITAVKNVWRQIYQKRHICITHNFCQILLVTLSYTLLCLFNVYVIMWVSYFQIYRASSPLGGASENSSTENMNGDAKPTNSKVRFTYLFMNFIKKVLFTTIILISKRYICNFSFHSGTTEAFLWWICMEVMAMMKNVVKSILDWTTIFPHKH